jgi:hypothetical protein
MADATSDDAELLSGTSKRHAFRWRMSGTDPH